MTPPRVAAALQRDTARPVPDWLAAIADALLTRTAVVAGRTEFRVVECETYYHAEDHPDPYVHRHPVQAGFGRWYLHRVGRGFRGGTYKGIDLTFGDGTSFGGVLVRGLDGPAKVRGPSKCVDALLAATGCASPAALDAEFAGRPAWDPALSVRLVDADHPAVVVASMRVGLSARPAGPTAADYRARSYRFRVVTPRTSRPPSPPRP